LVAGTRNAGPTFRRDQASSILTLVSVATSGARPSASWAIRISTRSA